MALMYPREIAPDTASPAERLLFRFFRDQLPEQFRVFHSVEWNILQPERGQKPIGEADFVVAHPDLGLLILEVKGGSIRADPSGWYTRARDGSEWKPLKQNPAEQARSSVYALKKHLEQSRLTKTNKYALFEAVAFPDVRFNVEMTPQLHRDLIIDESKLDHLEKAIRTAYDYWHKRYVTLPHTITPAGMKALVNLLSPTFEIPAQMGRHFSDEAEVMKQLTESQYQVLRLLKRHNRAVIAGGAGTGKTMLAEEKMRQLVDSNFRVLFLCYNRNLKNRIERDAKVFQDRPNPPTVSTYLGLNNYLLGELGKPPLKIDSFQVYEAEAADRLVDVITQLRTKKPQALFDAIIVDEGQDFRGHWWIPLPDLLRDPANGILYVFFDDNQRLYEQIEDVPLPVGQQTPYILDVNCRNTQKIFMGLKPYATASVLGETICAGPDGRAIERHAAKTPENVTEVMQTVLTEWIDKRGLKPNDIVILTPRARETSQWQDGQRLGKFKLSWNLSDETGGIRVSTIHGFKGLESPVVILTEMQVAHEQRVSQLAYVAMSRARNHLIIIGELPEAPSV